ncbi:hypothetical protein [Pontibacter harenae]|uniref:hypothetical protein n=1 Tax=Pontibacter harenae TaxID=2894083 RepID=UPI001E557709|nr:hypothetical protein [Pontibacter harenae]MCC9165625.1 hypothetical protein [Pontibacter harenae]
MNLDEMKANWQNASTGQHFQKEELNSMTRLRQHPVLNRIRTKLVVEAVAMLALLFLFNDAFDGSSKPMHANVTLIFGALLYLGSNLYSFFVLQHPILKLNIQDSLQHFLQQLYRIRTWSLVASILYTIGILLFFSSNVVFDFKKLLILGAIMVAVVVFLYFSYSLWTKWIDRIRLSARELLGEE